MKFVDEALITVRAGKGGKGCVSFRRERHLPLGGPNGGDGGNGGDVYLRVDANLNTLADFRTQRLFKAANGMPGQGSDKNGKNGDDLFIHVPPGTLVYNADTDELIGDLNATDLAGGDASGASTLLVARGGQRGFGNAHFKSAAVRAPRRSSPGTDGDEFNLRLELKLIADVGLLGLPNAGKSTLLRAISSSRSKVGDYPFTTLHPVLGVVEYNRWQSFVVSDMPGLIRGASAGAGLGLKFLRHIQRTRLLLHLVDIGTNSVEQAVDDFNAISEELRLFDASLIDKERWLVCTKCELCDDAPAKCREIVDRLNWKAPSLTISSVSHLNLDQLKNRIMDFLQ